jgi:hypothetical protein
MKKDNKIKIINFRMTLGLVAVVVGAMALGVVLANDQSYSPLPSMGGIVVAVLVLSIPAGFTGYANLSRYSSVEAVSKRSESISLALAALLLGIVFAYFVRMLTIF